MGRDRCGGPLSLSLHAHPRSPPLRERREVAVEASPPMPQCHTRFGGWLEVRPPPSFWQRGTLLPLPLLLLLPPPRCHKGFPYSGFVVALPSSGGGGERETKSTVGRCQQRGRVSHSSAERESSPLPLLLLRQCSDAMKMVHSSLPRAYHHACPATREKLSRPRLFFSPPPYSHGATAIERGFRSSLPTIAAAAEEGEEEGLAPTSPPHAADRSV